MSVGNTSHPSFSNGITSPENWINFILDLLSFSAIHAPAQYVNAIPGTIVPGQLYLVGTGSNFATPGTIAVFLTPLASSIIGIIPDNGTVVDGWTKIAGDWVKSEFVNNSQVVVAPTVATVFNLPTSFEGVCTLVNNGTSTVQVNAGPGRTGKGQIGVALTEGVYTIYQDSTYSNVS